jgi:hypothetical protein
VLRLRQAGTTDACRRANEAVLAHGHHCITLSGHRMNVIELACFVGLPSIVALAFLIGTPIPLSLALFIGLGSAVVSLLIIILTSFVYRLFRRRLPDKSPVFVWAVIAVLLSGSIALWLRLHPIEHKRPSNTAQHTATSP